MQKTLYIPIETTLDNTFECEKLIKRGDILTLTIKVFNNGALVDLTGQSIDLILKKSDNTIIQNTINSSNVSSGVVTATLEQQSTLVSGTVSGELQIYTETTLTSTNTFTFEVQSSLADDVLEISKNDIKVLNDLRVLINQGQIEINEYKDNILAIGNTVEAIEALANIKSYIDTNLPILEAENAKAVVNIPALKTENDKAPDLTTNLKAENDKAPQLIIDLKTENNKAPNLIVDLTNVNDTAEELKNTLEIDITNANASKEALNTSKTNADNTKNALDQSVEVANNFVEAHQDVENLINQVNSNTSQLSDIAYSIKTFGAKGDGITDDLAIINSAILEVSNKGGGKIIFPQSTGDYMISNAIAMQDNVILEWTGNSFIKLSQATTTGGMITGANNIKLINPLFDGNNIPSQNGIGGVGGVKDIFIQGGHLKNFKREPVYGGGRAISCQLGVDSCIAQGVKIENCTIALDVHGQNVTNKYSKNILYSNIVVENCDEIFSSYDLDGTYGDLENQNCLVSNIVARNCGKSSNGAIDEGGCFVFERGSGVKISNVQIINDASYGKIGGLFRGKGYDMELSNILFVGDAIALFNGTNATSITPVVGDTSVGLIRLLANNIKHIGTIDYVVKSDTGGSTKMSQCYFNNIFFDRLTTTTGKILDTEASGKTDCWGQFIQLSSLKERSGKFNFINAYSDTNLSSSILRHIADPLLINYILLGVSGSDATIGTTIDKDVIFRRNNVNYARLTSGGFKVENSTWNSVHLVMGTYHIWIDSTGKPRIKNGAPTSDTDGQYFNLT